jgi:hypothetical protein
MKEPTAEQIVRFFMNTPPATSGHAYKMIVDEEKETRSSEQNRKMWAMLGEIAEQLQINGQSFDKDRWKAIMLHAWGEQVEFLPTLDGTSFFPYGHQTSKLSTKKMSSFLEFIIAEGAQRGVKFADDVADHAR